MKRDNPKERILLVEDEPQLRELYDALLRPNFRLDTAPGAAEALRAIRAKGPYAVVISDQHMPPGPTGLELLTQVRREFPDTICVLLTGQATFNEAIAALNSGVLFRFLTKPCLQESLLKCVDAGIEQYRVVTVEKRRLEQLVASITSILIGISEDDRIIQWNKSAEQAFRLAAAEVLDEPIESLPIPWDWPIVLSAIANSRVSTLPIRLDNVAYTRHDGSHGLLGLSLTQLASVQAKSKGVLIVGADVTEHRLLESQLREAQKLEAIGRLSAGVAHEINTPTQYVGDNIRFLRDTFADVIGLLQKVRAMAAARDVRATATVAELRSTLASLDLDYLTQEIPRAIQESLEGIGRTAKIVGAMKEFSHPAEEKVPTDLNRAIESTITVARSEWKYVAELITNLDQMLPQVPCLPGEFNQVILNLIVNSSHAISEVLGEGSAKKGTIEISTRQAGQWAEIRVADTGGGIPMEIRRRIFDPFFTTKEVGKGTGQGLSIAHAVVVQKHGGTITVDSEVGKGTTFLIRLPIVAAPAAVNKPEEVGPDLVRTLSD